MRTIIAIALLLAALRCQGADAFGLQADWFGLPPFDAKPATIESHRPDWHAPLLPPELFPPPATKLAPTAAPAIDAFSNPLAGPRGTILGVSRASDKRSLTVQYELAGMTNEQKIILTNGIVDFYFCSWATDRGIALSLSDTAGEVYWATAYFAHLVRPLYPRRIRSPHRYKLMSIACPVGDTIVVTATDEILGRGWIYKNAYPPAWNVFFRARTNAPAAQIQMSGFDHLTEFEIPGRREETKK